MTSWPVRIGLIAAFASAVAALVVIETKYARSLAFKSSSHCLRSLLFDTPREINVVLIGSSRIQQGISVEAIAVALGTSPTRVGNLGHPWMSMAFDYGIVREISDRQPLRMVVMEVFARSPAMRARERSIYPRLNSKFDLNLSSGSYEQLYLIGGSTDEQMLRVWRHTDNAIVAVHDILRLISERIVSFLSILTEAPTRVILALADKDQAKVDKVDLSKPTACFHEQWALDIDPDARRAAEHQGRRNRYARVFNPGGEAWVDPDPLGFIDAPEFVARHAAIDDLVALGQERGFSVVFIYLPSVHTPHPSGRLSEAFEARFGAPLILPEPKVRNQLADGGFDDHAHLNNKGRKVFSAWLGETLSALERELEAR